MTDNKLTAKQELFCEEYLVDLNATQAAIRAGYSKKTARDIACENLTKPNIQEKIQELRQERSEKVGVNAEMVVRELMRVGFGDPRKIASWNNDTMLIKNSNDLSEDDIAMVGGVVQKKSKYGDTIEVKFNDKLAALDKLARHIGLYQDSLDVKKTVEISDEDRAILKRAGIKVDE